MKKYFFVLLSCGFLCPLKGISQDTEFVIPRNEDLTIKAEDGTLISGVDVYSMNSKLKRKITLTDPKSNTVLGEAFIRLESYNADQNMYEVLDKEPEKFSGVLVIESQEGIIYRREIIEGKLSEGQSTSGRNAGNLGGGPGPVYNPNLRCTVNNIHNCVAYRVEGMNWWQLGLCLVRAPACYLEQWAYCSYDVCINHMQYTNPN